MRENFIGKYLIKKMCVRVESTLNFPLIIFSWKRSLFGCVRQLRERERCCENINTKFTHFQSLFKKRRAITVAETNIYHFKSDNVTFMSEIKIAGIFFFYVKSSRIN